MPTFAIHLRFRWGSVLAMLSACVLPVPAAACSCGWQGAFLEVGSASALIARVRVDDYGARLASGSEAFHFMRVTVMQTLHGRATADTLRIYGDTGMLCRPYITSERFAAGAEYVVALHRADFRGESGYALSGCGEFWLGMEAGQVRGRIRSEQAEAVEYATFVEWLGQAVAEARAGPVDGLDSGVEDAERR